MNFRIDAFLAASVIVLAAAPALAASRPHEAINGVWMVRPEYYVGAKLSPQPDLTPAAEAQRKRRAAASAKGYVRSVGNMLCEGGGGPSLFMVRSPFEVFSGFGRLTFIFETETFNQPRTVYLREKAQPADIFPSANGHSIGHWEGNVLVVDTAGFNDRGALLGGIQRSDKAHMVERFSVSGDGKVLTDEVRMEDPLVLAKPWTVKLMFDRSPDTEERFEVSCDVDLDAFATLDLKSLAGADPEVDRLLDPERRGTDPALKIASPASK
ncbi:MAG: hypothetical protein WDN45_00355 [Caulobacteraceae bacterium]